MAHTPPHLARITVPPPRVVVPAARSARPANRRRPLEVPDRAGVLAALRAVGATRRPGPPMFDPARADRSSTRRHGATRHGQARDTAALVAAAVDHGLGDALDSERAHRLVGRAA